jgi:UDP-N-acetylmuramoylalanine--D-glutamate ligase
MAGNKGDRSILDYCHHSGVVVIQHFEAEIGLSKMECVFEEIQDNRMQFHSAFKSDLLGKDVLVVGLGISGFRTALCLSRLGAKITVSDIRSEQDLDSRMLEEIREAGGILETGAHKRETFFNSELIIVSPGVPQDMEPLQTAKARNIPIMGELELASRLIDTPIIAVTGTNGKSTVTAFLGSMLENAGLNVFVGGNIGTPLIAYAAEGPSADYAVVEVSSFQLDTIETFCPLISIILNISPDHLDRYADYNSYVRSKLNIFKNQGPEQYLIMNDDDTILDTVHPSNGVHVLRYGFKKGTGREAFLEDKVIRVRLPNRGEKAFLLHEFRLPGRHNIENLMGVVLVGLILDINETLIQKTINGFKGLPNRLEHVADQNDVQVYNDSKATNIDAAIRAITSFERPIILIAGGRHKGADYDPLVKAAQGRVSKAIFLGEARELLARAFDGIIPYSMSVSMEDAVSQAFQCAKPGDVVLLAPACSSFDMFSDYAHRGRVFRTVVEKLIHG